MKDKTNKRLFKWFYSLEQDERDIVMDYADGYSETEIYEEYGETPRIKSLISTYDYYAY